MPLSAAQNAFYLYGWHVYPWASSPRPAAVGFTATPTAAPKSASVVLQLPTGSQAAAVTAQSGRRSGAPDKKSQTVQVAGGGSATVVIGNLATGVLHYIRGVATYADGTQALTAVETTVTPT